MTKITVGSLFSGIGGLELGLERAGMEVRWQVENNPYALRVLEKHWPHVKRHTDIKTFLADPEHDGRHDSQRSGHNGRVQQPAGRPQEPGGGQQSEAGGPDAAVSVDLICGGFPCQPVSISGKQRGDADDRWLWDEMRRVCSVVRPRWVLAENVPGLLSASSGRLFGTVVRDMAALGYAVEWFCLSAANVGAHHIRDRVFIIGHMADPDRPGSQGHGRLDHERNGAGELPAGQSSRAIKSWWEPESSLGRVAHGVPRRVDRLRCLGNAVVPQVSEYIGRMIIAADVSPT